MGASTSRRARRGRLAAAVATSAAASAILFAPARPAGAAPGCTPVLGRATATPSQLATWFATTGRQAKLDVSVLDLATMFVEEGAREGVRGDIAFAQAIVETGYFGFSPSVPPEMHNYSGIGATGGGVKGAGFPNARTGVRAQVQHLRAYADPSLRSAADLKAPLVDPRFGFLVPNASTVACWEQFGNGIWAADPSGYGPRVLSVQQRISAVAVPAAPVTAAPPAPVAAPVEVPPAAVAAAPDPGLSGPGAVAPDLVAGPPLLLDTATVAAADTRVELASWPAVASSSGGGVAGALAATFSGLGLLSLCATLWWHGRRFARS